MKVKKQINQLYVKHTKKDLELIGKYICSSSYVCMFQFGFLIITFVILTGLLISFTDLKL